MQVMSYIHTFARKMKTKKMNFNMYNIIIKHIEWYYSHKIQNIQLLTFYYNFSIFFFYWEKKVKQNAELWIHTKETIKRKNEDKPKPTEHELIIILAGQMPKYRCALVILVIATTDQVFSTFCINKYFYLKEEEKGDIYLVVKRNRKIINFKIGIILLEETAKMTISVHQ